MEKTPRRRLGFKRDAEDLKKHAFFSNVGFNWKKLEAKEYEAPIIPELKGKEDVSQFAEDFTKQDPVDLPGVPLIARNAARFFRGKREVRRN